MLPTHYCHAEISTTEVESKSSPSLSNARFTSGFITYDERGLRLEMYEDERLNYFWPSAKLKRIQNGRMEFEATNMVSGLPKIAITKIDVWF